MDQGWTIDIDAVGVSGELDDADFDERLAAFEQALDPYSGAVAASDARDRYGARFSLDTESINPVEVLELGLEVFHDAAIDTGLPAWQVVRCEVLTYEEDDTQAAGDTDSA
jgi:hypothetical protein